MKKEKFGIIMVAISWIFILLNFAIIPFVWGKSELLQALFDMFIVGYLVADVCWKLYLYFHNE